MKTFNDLQFKPHPNGRGGIQAIMEFENGHRISVVGGNEGLYGDGVETFEIWRSCDPDVKGHGIVTDVTHEYYASIPEIDIIWYLLENDQSNLVNHWVPEDKLQLHIQTLRQDKLDKLGI